MQTSTYDFTELDAWAEEHPEVKEFVNAIKTVLDNGMDPDALVIVLKYMYDQKINAHKL